MTSTHAARESEVTAPRLSALLVDGITEVVALPTDPVSRAVAIESLVHEMHLSVEWVNATDEDGQESVSFARVLAESQRHSDRMRAASNGSATTAATAPPALEKVRTSDVEVSSYDDLSVTTDAAGRVVVACPACGSLSVSSRETTLSDLTNVAMTHLSEQHPYTLTLPSRRSRALTRAASPQRVGLIAPSGYFTQKFWSRIALLREGVSGIETLVRALASSSAADILDFQEQLRSALDMLDTPQQRAQHIWILDEPLHTRSTAISESQFEDVRLAVVAAGRDVWLDVLADPSRLAGGWPLQRSRGLLAVPEVALRRQTAPTLHLLSKDNHHNVAAGAA